MLLNHDHASDTSADVGGRARTVGPNVKLNGVPFPQHIKQAPDELVEAQDAAYKVMGGKTAVSFGDELAEAAKAHIAASYKKFGGRPPSKDSPESPEYVARVAEANRRDLRESLLNLASGADDSSES